MSAARLAVLAVALALTAGCSSAGTARLEAGDELRALRAAAGGRLGAHRVLLAPPPALAEGAAPREAALSAPMRLDARELAAELERALAALVPPEAERPQVALAEAADTAAEQAWDQGYDLLARVRVVRWRAAFLGTNGWWWPNALFLGWYFWPVGPWLIADEDYGLDLELEVTVEDVASGRPLAGLDPRRVVIRSSAEAQGQPLEPLAVVPATRLSLDDLDRGIDLFSTWFGIGDLDPEQWEQVGALLEPHALRLAAVRAAAAIADGVASFDRRPAAQRTRELATVHAVIAGVSIYPDQECAGADADAARFGALLAGEAGGEPWAPAKNLTVLENAQVGRSALYRALARLRERARPSDTVVVYFAGRGKRRRARGLLAGLALEVPPDERPRSHLVTLEELATWVRAIPARQRVIVLDVDFTSGPRAGAPEGFAAAPPPLEAGALEPALRQAFFAGGVPGGVVLASRLRAGEQAQTYEGQGLLTRYLIEGLAGAADEGGDGLTWRDLATYLERHVGNLSEVALPAPQHPLVVGAGADEPLR